MSQQNFRNASVSTTHFSMVPRAGVPRSTFLIEHTHKTAFDAGLIIPLYLQEALPGDHFQVDMTAFCRMSTPLFPVMDNLHLDSFFFFVPNRLVWDNWKRFMGERPTSPNNSIDFVIPQATFSSPPSVGGLADYFGIPTAGQVTGPLSVSALPFRGYQLIWNDWFRDQNLQNAATVITGDGPDTTTGSRLLRPRNKRPDYFTTALPWPQKGDSVSLPIAGLAPIRGIGVEDVTRAAGPKTFYESGAPYEATAAYWSTQGTPSGQSIVVAQNADSIPQIFADLSEATGATINALRQSMAVQQLLERDARGGSRYVEILLAHFGVQPQDARLNRPEYIGGGSTPVNINPIAQQSEGTATSPLGALGGISTALNRNGFSYAVQEHGFIFGLVSVRADLTYQQGLNRMWSRQTRYDFYWPEFAHLGEQAILRKEIYCTGDPDLDNEVFGYQERWSEYRYHPSMITGIMRSTAANNIDEWHAAQWFQTPPVLSDNFIREDPPMSRILAAGNLANGQQFICDALFRSRVTRPMPTYSVPGLADRF